MLLLPATDDWVLRRSWTNHPSTVSSSGGAVQLHLIPDDPDGPDGTGGVVYVYVSDANALHAQWAAAGVEGRFMGPHDTPYGLREFVYTDPDGIVHRVGSPL